MAKRFVVTATGDSLITRRMPAYSDPAFRGLVELIHSADVAFTNMEMVLSDYHGVPVVESGGMWLATVTVLGLLVSVWTVVQSLLA